MAINTKQGLIKWIERKLGSPIIDLETHTEQIEDNIDDAILHFTKYSGDATYRNALVMSFSAGENHYTLAEGITSVLNVETIKDATDGINVLFSPMNQMYTNGFFDFLFKGGSGGSLVTYEMGMEYLDMAEDILGGRYVTEYNKYSRTLTLTPTPDEALIGILEVYTRYDPGTADSTIYNEIWVKEYALALTKITLGRILTKYNGVALPGGGTLNGADLLKEGLEEKKDLDDKLIKNESEPLEMIFE
jgi:hypothetical protein